jgi:mRNA interferase RelE/StbE
VASYSLEIKRSAAKELAGLPKQDRARIITSIQALAHEPRPAGSEKLSGQERYRIRRGDYRILYQIHDDVLILMVVRIGHRRDVYRK